MKHKYLNNIFNKILMRFTHCNWGTRGWWHGFPDLREYLSTYSINFFCSLSDDHKHASWMEDSSPNTQWRKYRDYDISFLLFILVDRTHMWKLQTALTMTKYQEQFFKGYFISVQSLNHVQHFAIPWTAARQASLSITNSRSLLKLISIETVMPSNHLICCHLLLFLPSIFPSIRVFSNESALRIRWPKDWSFSINISPSNEHSGLISFRMDWLDILAVQGTP